MEDEVAAEIAALELKKLSIVGSSSKSKKARSRINKKIASLKGGGISMETSLKSMSPAYRGCHIAHGNAEWLIGVDRIRPKDFGFKSVKEMRNAMSDFSINPDDNMLSVFNLGDVCRSFFITLSNCSMETKDGLMLEKGFYRDESGQMHDCFTLVLVIEPWTLMDVGYVIKVGTHEFDLASDIKDLSTPTLPKLPPPSLGILSLSSLPSYNFPLAGEVPFLCTQGCGGCFTHFFPQTMYAIDIQAPVGTSVLAIDDGEVVSIIENNTVSGIHCGNLFKWNSIMIKLKDGLYAEYVHIKAFSSRVKVGEKVNAGDVLCASGEIGFCPEAHLHIQICTSEKDDAVTVPFTFKVQNDEIDDVVPPETTTRESGVESSVVSVYIPEAGKAYTTKGEAAFPLP